MPSLLVIDDDRAVLHLVARAFAEQDVEILTAHTSEEGLALAQERGPDVVLLDIMLPGVSGFDLIEELRRGEPRLPVIFITARDDSETAIGAMKRGAYDYLVKPLDVGRLRELVRQAMETRRIMSIPVGIAAEDVGDDESEGSLLVGCSPQMLEVYKAIGRVSNQDVTVLIRGESGTGKELVARAIHLHSARADKPFLAVNCAALPEALLESELFGHEKGAFTGAESRHIGKFEQLTGGTIFLDEIGDMSPLVQSKVLRLLQEQKFERVGGSQTIQTDVRIIAATNRDLQKMVQKDAYRSDLYYRLNGVTIEIPPLRERGEDLVLLIENFLGKYRRRMKREGIEGIAPEAVEILKRYRWPGNVRELESVVRLAVMNATGPVIVPACLPDDLRNGDAEGDGSGNGSMRDDLLGFVQRRLQAGTENLYAESLELMERCLLSRVLQTTSGNQSHAAKILGITRGSLRNKIRSLGISIEQVVNVEGDGE
ncbi:MAG: sigma-54 dependent transcriptional regulator [Planctomycetales bacterium]